MATVFRGGAINRYLSYVADSASAGADAMVEALDTLRDKFSHPGLSATAIERFGDLWEIPDTGEGRIKVLDALSAHAWASSDRAFAHGYLTDVADRARASGDDALVRHAVMLRVQGKPIATYQGRLVHRRSGSVRAPVPEPERDGGSVDSGVGRDRRL
jgi:hypothetical protein